MSTPNTTRIVLYPCPHHLPRGRTFTMGDALGDLFLEHPDGSRVRFASCRECKKGLPPHTTETEIEHYPLHNLPGANA